MDGIKTQINTNKSSNIEFHTKTQQSQQKIASKNPLERNPERDKFEKREKTKFIAFGTIAALAIAAGIEFFAFKGKHFDEIVSKFKNKKPKEPPKTEPPKTGETPKTSEAPKVGETPATEVKPTEQAEVLDAPKVNEKINVEETAEIPENIVIEEIIPEGKAIEETIPEIKTVEEIIPEKNPKIRALWDKITSKFKRKKATEEIREINGQNFQIKKVEPPKPKILKGINKSKYPKIYTTREGFKITEEIYTTSGNEYIHKTIEKDGVTIKELSTHYGSTKTNLESIYENGINTKDIYYQKDGSTIDHINFLDINGNTIERHYYNNGKIHIEKYDVPKPMIIKGINKTEYPKNCITQEGFEITEEIYTTLEGHEYIRKSIKKDGVYIKELSTHYGSTKTNYESIYENGINTKDIYYQKDGSTIDHINILDINGNTIEVQYPV